jgi:phospholipid/cholesterol/gamma-HCH transport system substrate-binding protein
MQSEAPIPPSPPPPPANVEFKAIVLLTLMALLIVSFVVYVMYARGVFEATQRLVLVADDSEGVLVGMDMTFSGFPIGRVQRIELGKNGKARILIDVPLKDANWLRSSSVFTIERGLVGDTHIRAFSGMLTDPPLPPDAERMVLRGDVAAEIPRLVASARTLLDNLGTMTSSDSSLNTSLANIQSLTRAFNGRYGVMGGALGGDENARKIMEAVDHANALLAKTDQRVFGKRGVMDDAQATVAQLNGVLSDARASLKKLDTVLADAQAISSNARSATTDLGLLRSEVDASLHKINVLMDDLNRKWPFRRDTELKLP